MISQMEKKLATWQRQGREQYCHLSSPKAGWGEGNPKPHADYINPDESQAEDEAHRIAPLVFKDTPEMAFARLKQVFDGRGDTTIIEERPGYLWVEFHTLLFVDDGEFLLDAEQRLIQVRSASRLGYSDLGKNRRRLEEIRQSFSELERSPKGFISTNRPWVSSRCLNIVISMKRLPFGKSHNPCP